MEDDYEMIDNDKDKEITQEDAWTVINAYFEAEPILDIGSNFYWVDSIPIKIS